MAAASIDLRATDDPRDVVHRVVQALTEGKLVALPTETVYMVAASATHEGALQRLSTLVKSRCDLGDSGNRVSGQPPFLLAVQSAESARDYVPHMPLLAERLARRCWPGPLTMVLPQDRQDGLVRQLPARTLQVVSTNDKIAFRVPAHDFVLAVLRLVAGPLAMADLRVAERSPLVTAQDVAATVGSDIDLIVDDGQSKFAQPASVVEVQPEGLTLVHAGVLGDTALQRLSSLLLLFVCTGNTCRSPMAEWLMKRHLSRRLGCEVGQLEERGVLVMSAGLAAMAGARASEEATEVLRAKGLDLRQHESQPVNDRLVRYADFVLTMTRGHRDAILGQWPDAAPRTHLVKQVLDDVADPFGGTVDEYRHCMEELDAATQEWLAEFDRSGLLPRSTLGV